MAIVGLSVKTLLYCIWSPASGVVICAYKGTTYAGNVTNDEKSRFIFKWR